MRPLWLVLWLLLLLPFPALAQLPSETYTPVVLQARVQDRHGRPVSGLKVRLAYTLDGTVLQDDGRVEGVFSQGAQTVATDPLGLATVHLSGSPWTQQAQWFRGRVDLTATLPADPAREIGLIDSPAAPVPFTFPTDAPQTLPTLTIYEQPDITLGPAHFPVWVSRDRKLTHVAVVLAGFDLYNRLSATDIMELISPAADALRDRGLSVLVVHFPDSHLPPDQLAPRAAQAIRAAAAVSGHQVAVIGLSAGGIVARWALVTAEEQGTPLPVQMLMSVDCPNRGATINPALQALTLRYGKPEDKAALGSEAAHVLLTCQPKHIKWRYIGLPELGREMPVAYGADTTAHDAFYDRLRHLNDHGGYPKLCRLIGVSSGSRHGDNPGGGLLSLWVPFDYRWTLPPQPADHAPGSLLPPYYVGRFTTVFPLGVAGAFLKSAPTFISTESALDAGPNETPPFDVWYARPDNAPQIPHDRVAPDEARFIVEQLLTCSWPRS